MSLTIGCCEVQSKTKRMLHSSANAHGTVIRALESGIHDPVIKVGGLDSGQLMIVPAGLSGSRVELGGH